MKTKVYCVYDSASLTFGKPIPVRAEGQILRDVKVLANDKEIVIGQNPEDHFLYEIGTYDDSKGELKSCKPRKVCCFNDYVDRTVVPLPSQNPAGFDEATKELDKMI